MSRLFNFTGGAAVALILAGCGEGSIVQPTGNAPLVDSGASARPEFVFPGGCCFYEGQMVRTVVPPASTPQEGRDNFYAFPNGAAAGQKGVVAVAPGDLDYHGGHWAFYAVTFNVTPYLLTSEAAVLAAASAGDVSVARVPANDFKCPIQP
jgi:hypothetical protein